MLEHCHLQALPDDDNVLIRRADLPMYLPISNQTAARWAHEGRGPKFIKIGERLVAYRVRDIREWLQAGERVNTAQ